MYFVECLNPGFSIRSSEFRDDLDPGWKERLENNSNVKQFATMAEADKFMNPNNLTCDDTWKLAHWIAIQARINQLTEVYVPYVDAKPTAENEQKQLNTFGSHMAYDLVSGLSKMEKAGLLNVPEIEKFVAKLDKHGRE